jgi:hypothetical protein
VKKRLALTVAAVPLLFTACGGGSSSTTATHVMPNGSTMSGASMSAMPGMTGMKASPGAKDSGQGGGGPSESASLICGSEIREAVEHTLRLSHEPVGLHAWQNRVFSCTYQLRGDLRLSVKDLDTAGPGRAYFDHLRSRLPGATTITGLEAFGFPAFETAHGDVVFLKDHKTLWVDASRLRTADLRSGQSREDAAYGVAAAVIACWTE